MTFSTNTSHPLYPLFSILRKDNSPLRKGQALMDKLHSLDREMYKRVISTEYDPFYLDYLIMDFLDFVFNPEGMVSAYVD